jgi:hypothetical protein
MADDKEGLTEEQKQIVANLSWSHVAKALSDHMTETEHEWCGFPMPLPGLGLVIEDKNPHREKVAQIQQVVDEDRVPKKRTPDTDDEPGWHIVNEWHCAERNGRILVLHHDDGRKTFGFDSYLPRRNNMWLGPIESSDAWSLDAEYKAMTTLQGLLNERMWRIYVLTGTFLETSKRSGVHYMFRRCRPTLAFTGAHSIGDEVRILAALCLHPIGFYANSFAGAMTPTDDVIAHLLMMRGDEHLFWRRANQHPPDVPEAGL